MSELAALTDVGPAAIKFYIKEGLLPAPVKTSRNMAYYDELFVEKIRLIKQLQSQHYLPLRVIKDLLSRTSGSATLEETRALLALKGSLPEQLPAESRDALTEEEVIRRLNTYAEELETLRRMGLVNPREVNGARMYGEEDQVFLELLENNRRLGFKGEYWSLRFSGVAAKAPHHSIEPMTRDDLEKVAALDRRFFGLDRAQKLRRVETIM